MSRKRIAAANWKMNLHSTEALQLMKSVQQVEPKDGVEVIIAPPMLYLSEMGGMQGGKISLAAQNCSAEENGAFTGEVSVSMLKDVGVKFIIVGHSERRLLYRERDEIVASKVKKVLEHSLIPIFCCGELLEERENREHEMVIANQLRMGLFELSADQLAQVVIAYEPVWAIGTGKTASPEEAQEMHAFIRNFIAKKFGQDVADNISILYGGSVKPANAAQIFSKPDIDGGLVGGASLKIDDFTAIIASL